jgi:hypothetical protein
MKILSSLAVIAVLLFAGPAGVRKADPRQALLSDRPLSVAADFDGDGAVDVAGIAESGLQVRLSGQSPLVLLFVRDRLARIVAADIDRDGDLDILGLTCSGRVIAWGNSGGRFERIHARPVRSSRLFAELALAASAAARPGVAEFSGPNPETAPLEGRPLTVSNRAGPVQSRAGLPAILRTVPSSSPRSPPSITAASSV